MPLDVSATHILLTFPQFSQVVLTISTLNVQEVFRLWVILQYFSNELFSFFKMSPINLFQILSDCTSAKTFNRSLHSFQWPQVVFIKRTVPSFCVVKHFELFTFINISFSVVVYFSVIFLMPNFQKHCYIQTIIFDVLMCIRTI